MPVDPNATAEITAFRWVPDFAAGLVRDLRIRWALEEIERSYRVRLLDATNPRPAEYFQEQPFGQVRPIGMTRSSCSKAGPSCFTWRSRTSACSPLIGIPGCAASPG